MAKSQVPDVFPDVRVLKLQATGNLYAVENRIRSRGNLGCTFICYQLGYDPVSDVAIIGPQCFIEEEMVMRTVHDDQGRLIVKPMPKRWAQVDWRRVPPAEVRAIAQLLGGRDKRLLAWFQDENVYTQIDRAENLLRREVGSAEFARLMTPTSRSNPEIVGPPKTQIVRPDLNGGSHAS